MTYKIYYSKRFLKSSLKLPTQHRAPLASKLELLQKQPFDSRLHSKALSGKLAGLYSFRITREYRVIFRFITPIEIELTDIAHRKDIYR